MGTESAPTALSKCAVSSVSRKVACPALVSVEGLCALRSALRVFVMVVCILTKGSGMALWFVDLAGLTEDLKLLTIIVKMEAGGD